MCIGMANGGKSPKYQIIRHWNGSKGFGKKFDTIEEARKFLQNDEKVQMDREDGFTFSIEVITDVR